MAVKAVTGAAICGARKHSTQFVGTGNAKGNYAVSICDQRKHSGPWHRDSVTGEEWKA